MIPTDRYCHSGPGNGDTSILTKLSVMPFLSWGGSKENNFCLKACDRLENLT